MDASFLQCLSQRVLVFDGAMGTNLHALNLPLADYDGHENCSEILVQTRPDVVEQIHRSFLEVGCDAVETNSFGANPVVLAEFGLADRVYELNFRAAQIAGRACRAFATPDRPRFVAGSIGPGTKLISLRQIGYDELVSGYLEQARGLLDGGVDVLLIETCQDILQAKAAIHAARLAFEACGRQVPLMCQITVEATGTMLMGTETAAAVVILEAFPEVGVIGLNCALGPREMAEHVRCLSRHCSRYLSVLPNAGLPEIVDGRPRFPLTPSELADWLRQFVLREGVNIVGGCCGTTPAHLQAVVQAVSGLRPGPRQITHEPAVSSLYRTVPVRQETSFLIVGERCNVNGSRQFKRYLAESDLDAVVALAREQLEEGAHVLDVCVDAVGRDAAADMRQVVQRLGSDLDAPLMLDSTDPGVIEAALKLAGGKCIVNSVSLEGGGQKLDRVCRLLRQYGAAVVALTIDDDPQEAMAKTEARKLAVATRLHDLLTGHYGIREEDIFFDCLTFPITTGNPEDRRLALETLDGLERVGKRFPNCQTILGISNVSFGLQPGARVVLNSAFLYEACQRGLTAAIVHAGKILPRNQIPQEHWQAALDLIYDRRSDGDPLERFVSLLADRRPTRTRVQASSLPIEDRLRQRIIDGQKAGLHADLEEALRKYPAVAILNDLLLEGMREVGQLFGSGQMQLPFVLRSAETMKAAVAYLQPHLPRQIGQSRGKIILATVRGDVHDIGKNLVDILLTNNGYTVYNLGIRQPIGNVIHALHEHQADAIGLSGLLVRSTQVMREDLEVLNQRGIRVPVILGGAALTRQYVEDELRTVYRGPLFYARDAFEGLRLMERVGASRPVEVEARPPIEIRTPEQVQLLAEQRYGLKPLDTKAARRARLAEAQIAQPDAGLAGPELARPAAARTLPVGPRPARSDIGHDHPVPRPPFWGSRVLERIDLDAALAYLNERMLFQVHWGFRREQRTAGQWKEYLEAHVRPIYRDLVERCRQQGLAAPQAVYGYWPGNSDHDELLIFGPPSGTIDRPEHHREVIARFRFPRQRKHPYWCLADFWRPIQDGIVDVVAASLVTVGSHFGAAARQLFQQGQYQQYVFMHGLGAELAEALAEYTHRRVRLELGVAGLDAPEPAKLFRQGYQGSRYSFGYPACPDLEDQAHLLRMLGAERVGVRLTETCQLDPEYSTTALITYHPAARYFSV